jgi:hypothetical protein
MSNSDHHSSPRGMPEALLLAHGISIEDVVGLIQAKLATARLTHEGR